MTDFILYLLNNIEWFIAGCWLIFSIMDWVFDKLDIKIGRQKKQEREYWEKRKIIRRKW